VHKKRTETNLKTNRAMLLKILEGKILMPLVEPGFSPAHQQNADLKVGSTHRHSSGMPT